MLDQIVTIQLTVRELNEIVILMEEKKQRMESTMRSISVQGVAQADPDALTRPKLDLQPLPSLGHVDPLETITKLKTDLAQISAGHKKVKI